MQEKRHASFFCHFYLCAWNIFNWSNNMGVYGLAWTPAIKFETIWTLRPILGPMALWPHIQKFAIFSTKTIHNMGLYGLAWTPAFLFQVIWTPVPNFGYKSPLATNLKKYKFSLIQGMGVYALAWTPVITFKVI